MKAMIFAAGFGTRLRPLTDNCPKALIEVGSVPILQRVILKLKNAGVNGIVINVHHLAYQIVDFLKQNNNFGIDIHISDESDLLLDTGGGILKARKWLDGSEPFIVHNVDIFTDFDILKMMKVHETSNADVTLLVDHRITSRHLLFCGNRMIGWENTKTGEVRSPWNIDDLHDVTPIAFGGVHIINPMIFKYLEQEKEKVFSITPFYVQHCELLDISGFTPHSHYNWVDIGRPESLAIARNIASAL
ncbi:MAG: nucleotidyltransferase family protein [Muribaculum sp.]|nr:nucleotidyltransferase family protein [Muribaculum sp.]